MKISIAQINTKAGDFSRTVERIVGISNSVAREGCDLLVLPLAALTGPLPVQYGEREGYLLDLSDALADLSERVACPCLVPIVTDMDDDPLPEAMLLKDGDVLPLKLSSYLADMAGVNVDSEGDDSLSTFELGGLRFGVAFTYEDLDDFLDEKPDVDVLVYIAGYGYALDDASSVLGADLAESRYLSDARELDAWFVGVGSLGGYGTQVYTGSSFVLAPWGELAAAAPGFEEAVVSVEVEPSAEGPLEHPLPPEVYNKPLYLWEALSLGVHDYLDKLGLSEVVLALDGGVSSLLLAVLASDALGPTHVHAVLAEGVSPDEARVSRQLAHNLRIDLHEEGDGLASGIAGPTPYEGPAAVGSPEARIPFDRDDAFLHDLTCVRVAALVRRVGGMALSCEDKTGLALESGPGTCMASQLMPFGDVYRSDVLELARLRNTISPVIPAEAMRSFQVPDIEGLERVGATDEERLARCDIVLASLVEWEQSLSDVALNRGERTITGDIARRLRDRGPYWIGHSLYLMVSSRTLFDARSPIGLAWHDHVRANDERVDERYLMECLQELTERSLDLAGAGREADEDAGESESERRAASERDVSDVLGFLHDLVQGDLGGDLGGRGLEDGSAGSEGGRQDTGPTGPLSWGGPFSEN